MVVIDASAAVQGLLTYAEARRLMTHEVLANPHLADSVFGSGVATWRWSRELTL